MLRDGLMERQAGFMVDVETIEHINEIENLFDERPGNGLTRNKPNQFRPGHGWK